MNDKLILEKGSLAYMDGCASGLVPCKVVSIQGKDGQPCSSQNITIEITKDYKAYKKGEILETSGLCIMPRKSLHYPNGHARIKSFTVKCDLPPREYSVPINAKIP